MRLTEYINNLRVELGDLDEDNYKWTDDELRRTVDSAIHDLDRYIPCAKTYEVTVRPTVTAEAWTSASAHGTYVQLANVMIKPSSETVTNAAGTTTYTRDTDYTIDYSNGKITTISGGSMAVGTGYKISYTKSKVAIDLSSLTDLIRVTSVEWPMGNVPQATVGFQVLGSILYLQTTVSTTTRSQTEASEGEHIAVHYEATNTGPVESASPSFPRHLDEVVIRGAVAKAMFILSTKQSGLGSEDMESARDQLDGIATIMAAIESALGNVAGHFTDADTALGNLATYQGYAKDQLDGIPAQVTAAAAAMTSAAALADEGAAAFDEADSHLNAVATILANVDTKVGTAETALGAVGADVTLAKDSLALVDDEMTGMAFWVSALTSFWTDYQYPYVVLAYNSLGSGSPLINKVNVGNDPAEQWRRYADTWNAIVSGAQESRVRVMAKMLDIEVERLNGYISRASQYVAGANARTAEASQRVALVGAYLDQASQRINAANGWIAKATGIGNAASTYLAVAGQRVAIINAYVSAAEGFYRACDQYVAEAGAHIQMGRAYIDQAAALMNEIQGKLGAANQFAQLAAQAVEVARGLREEGNSRMSEYISVLRDRSQWITERVVTSRSQPRG